MKYVCSNLTLKKIQSPKYKKIYGQRLKASSSLSGFKKTLFNHVYVREGAFEPRYNRRKHSIGQDLTLNQPLRKLNKLLPGFNLRRLRACVAFSLRHCYGLNRKTKTCSSLNTSLLEASVPTKVFVSLVESQKLNLNMRNMISKSLRQANQSLNHTKGKNQTLSLTLQKNGEDQKICSETFNHGWNLPGTVLRHA